MSSTSSLGSTSTPDQAAKLLVSGRHLTPYGDQVELGKQCWVLVQRAVLEDVDLDAGQDAKRRELLVELTDALKLPTQPISRQAVGHGQARGVIRQDDPFVAEVACGERHLADR